MGGAGRPKGSGTGHTVEVKSVSMTPESWRLLDELRGQQLGAARCFDRFGGRRENSREVFRVADQRLF
jgi:hypothetical protein